MHQPLTAVFILAKIYYSMANNANLKEPEEDFTQVKSGLLIKNKRIDAFKRKIKSQKRLKLLGYFLFMRYSCIAFAARLPAPIALMTVAAPVATSPPA